MNVVTTVVTKVELMDELKVDKMVELKVETTAEN